MASSAEETVAGRPRASRARQYVRLVIGIVLLGLLLAWVDLGAVLDALKKTRLSFVWIALLLSVSLDVLSAFKLSLLTLRRIPGIALPELVRLYFVAGFFNGLLPTSIGGDAYKIAVLARRAESLAAGGTAVALERFSGLVGAWTAALVLVLVRPAVLTPFHMEWLRWPLVIGSALVLAAAVFTAAMLARPATVFLRSRSDRRIFRLLWQVAESLGQYRRQPALLAAVLLLSISFHLVRALILLLLAASMGAGLAFAPLVWTIALVMIVSFVPISVGALGLREGTVTYCLSCLGVAAPEALAVALISRFIITLKSLAGGILYAAGPAFHPESQPVESRQ